MSRTLSAPVLPVVFATALLSSLTSAQLTRDQELSTVPAGSLKGAAALAAIGDRLDALAERHQTDADALSAELLRDDSLWVDGQDRLFFVDPAAPAESSYAAVSLLDMGPIPPEDAFILHSNPGAPRTIYLDFDGYHSTGNSWGHNIVFPSYDTDGDVNSFSNTERQEIIGHWRYVVEDFALFGSVDVTTEDPGSAALSDSGGSDQTWGMRCVMTQATSGFGDGIGGVAFLWSFDDSIDNPCFAFNKGINNGSMTASHEVGHTLGLSHDGLGGATYHPGTGSGGVSWGPIMGAPFGSNLVQWSNGDYSSSTTTQNDIAIIANSSNGLTVLPDDHGNSIGSPTPLSAEVGCPNPSPSTAVGIIERRTDVDAFSFNSSGGLLSISALPLDAGGNLDVRLRVFTSGGSLVGENEPANSPSATLNLDLTAGNYRILVEGVDNANSSDYGSLGNYRVNLSTQGAALFSNLGGFVPGLLGKIPKLIIEGGGCVGDPISFSLFGARANSPAWFLVSTQELSAPFKGGLLIPDLAAPSLTIPVTTSGVGSFAFPAVWPAGFPAGAKIYVQYWIQDIGAAVGFAATRGYEVEAP